MSEHKIFLRFLGELLGIFFLYALVLALSINVSRPLPEGIGRMLVLVSAMVPFLLMVRTVVRQLRRVDEYLRLQMLENIAIAAGVTAGWTLTYGFLENAGFSRLSMLTVLPVMGATWAVVALARRLAGR